MSISRKVCLLSLAGLISLAGLGGCGSASNNDQGTVFTAKGFYGPDPENPGAPGAAVSYMTGVLSSVEGSFDGIFSPAWIELDNNLVSTDGRDPYIRVTRIDCSYNIPGSDLVVPDETFAMGSVIPGTVVTSGDSNGSGSASGGASGSGGGEGDGASGRAEGSSKLGFPIYSTDIAAYLNNNRSMLPALPFEMVVTCNATGISRAGDTYTTNDVAITMLFVEIAEVNLPEESEPTTEEGA